jgi:hypothetical protein
MSKENSSFKPIKYLTGEKETASRDGRRRAQTSLFSTVFPHGEHGDARDTAR